MAPLRLDSPPPKSQPTHVMGNPRTSPYELMRSAVVRRADVPRRIHADCGRNVAATLARQTSHHRTTRLDGSGQTRERWITQDASARQSYTRSIAGDSRTVRQYRTSALCNPENTRIHPLVRRHPADPVSDL